MTIWVEKRIVVKRPKFCHVGFVSSEKHRSEVFFFAGLLFGFENGRMQKGQQVGTELNVFCMRNILKTKRA